MVSYNKKRIRDVIYIGKRDNSRASESYFLITLKKPEISLVYVSRFHLSVNLHTQENENFGSIKQAVTKEKLALLQRFSTELINARTIGFLS